MQCSYAHAITTVIIDAKSDSVLQDQWTILMEEQNEICYKSLSKTDYTYFSHVIF